MITAMDAIIRKMEEVTMLKKLPLMANVVLFLSLDVAGKITGVTIDVTSGTTAGLIIKWLRYLLTKRWSDYTVFPE